jgi:hypothetical protein
MLPGDRENDEKNWFETVETPAVMLRKLLAISFMY